MNQNRSLFCVGLSLFFCFFFFSFSFFSLDWFFSMTSPLEIDFLLHSIFGYLSVHDVPNVALVCRRFARAVEHDDVWREILPRNLPLRRFGRAPVPLRSIGKVLAHMYRPGGDGDEDSELQTDDFDGLDDGVVHIRSSAANDRSPDLFRCRHAPGQQLATATLLCSSADNDQSPNFTLEDRYFWSSVGRSNRDGREFIIYQLAEPVCWVTGVRLKAASLRRVYAPVSLSMTIGMTLGDVLPDDNDVTYWDDGDNFISRTKINPIAHKAVGPVRPTVMPPVTCTASYSWQSFQLAAPAAGGFVRVDFNGFLPSATHFVAGLDHLHYHCISSVVIAGYRGSRLPPEVCAATVNYLMHPAPQWRNVLQATSLRASVASMIRAHATTTVQKVLTHVQLLHLFLANASRPRVQAQRDGDPDVSVLMGYLSCGSWLDGVLDETDTEEGAVERDVLELIEASLFMPRRKAAELCRVRRYEAERVHANLSATPSALVAVFDFVLNRPFLAVDEALAQQQQQLDGGVERRQLSASLAPVSDGADALLATRLLVALRELQNRTTASER
jgi:hypothetical protein